MDVLRQLCSSEIVKCTTEVDDVVQEAEGLGIRVGGAAELLTKTSRTRSVLVDTLKTAKVVCVVSAVQNSASDSACSKLATLQKEVEGLITVLLPQEGIESAETLATKHGFYIPSIAYDSLGEFAQKELHFRREIGLGLACNPPEVVTFGRSADAAPLQLLGTDGAAALEGGTYSVARFPDWRTNALETSFTPEEADAQDSALAVSVSSDSAIRCGILPGDAAVLRIGPCRIPVWVNRADDQDADEEETESFLGRSGSPPPTLPDPLKVPLGRMVLSKTAKKWLLSDARKRANREREQAAASGSDDSPGGGRGPMSESKEAEPSTGPGPDALEPSGPAGRALQLLLNAGEAAESGVAAGGDDGAAGAGDGSAPITCVLDRINDVPVADCVGVRPAPGGGGPSSLAALLCKEALDRGGGSGGVSEGGSGGASRGSGSFGGGGAPGVAIGSTSPLLSKCLGPHFGLKLVSSGAPGASAGGGGMTAADRVLAALAQQGASSGAGAPAVGGRELDLGGLQAGTLSWLERLAGEAECKQRLIQFGSVLSVPVAAGAMGEGHPAADSVAMLEVSGLWPRCSVASVGPDTRFEIAQ